jgi:hypothetical protein
MRDKALKSLIVCLNHESGAGRGATVDIDGLHRPQREKTMA